MDEQINDGLDVVVTQFVVNPKAPTKAAAQVPFNFGMPLVGTRERNELANKGNPNG